MVKALIRFTCFLGIFIIQVGCYALSTLDRNVILDANSEDPIIIVGVSPKYRLGLAEGILHHWESKWAQGQGRAYALPENGYLVAKVPGNRFYFASVVRTKEHFFLMGPEDAYLLCGNEKQVVVTEVPAGKVVYYADLSFAAQDNNSIKVNYSKNFSKAKEYIAQYYPQFKDRMENAAINAVSCIPPNEMGTGMPMRIIINQH